MVYHASVRNSLYSLTKLTTRGCEEALESSGICVVVYFTAPPVLGMCGKMAVLDHCDGEYKQVWCVRLLLISTRAESLFERHSFLNRPVKRKTRPQEK